MANSRATLPLLTVGRHILHTASRWQTFSATGRSHSTRAVKTTTSQLPDSIKRVGTAAAFPNEYPGQVYAFNWCLNGDGVTPLRRSAFRITKPLDLKVAGLALPKMNPLKVDLSPDVKLLEAGSDDLPFDQFDKVSQRTRDLLSLSDHLYCPEGHVPGSRIAARIVTNSATLAPDLLAFLERAPRMEPPQSLPVTAYVLEGVEGEPSFAGFAIEEIEVPVAASVDDDRDWTTGYEAEPKMEAKSVAAVVVVGDKIDIGLVVAGLKASQEALAADEVERQSKTTSGEKA
ncbi:hypothetical protein MPSEU_000798000 [Mayamaea pseudoterrestris]|nr:hypothetical protein MPSEU_000798000 [Mayamaea pseudoterrestris]